MTPLLDVVDARTHFGGIRAVDGISLRLEPGKIYGVVGPNGSGKTTLVNAITRSGPLSSGSIVFDGVDLSTVPAHHLSRLGLARTFQSIRLVPTLSVRENVLLGADYTHDPRGRWTRAARTSGADAAEAAIDRLNIRHVAGERPDSLPYGAQRRVEIARALAGRPRLLLLDEPVAGMNGAERQEIAAVVRGLRETGLGVLVIEHDLRLLLELCDHLFVFNFGRCVAEGDPRETAALPVVRKAYLGEEHGVGA